MRHAEKQNLMKLYFKHAVACPMALWWLFNLAGNPQTIKVNTEHDPQEVLDCNFMELFFYECAKL